MLLACLWSLVAAAVPTARPQGLSPEMQMVVGSLREGERGRIEQVLGPIDLLPLYRAELDFNPRTRAVVGKVFVTITPKKEPLTELYLRSTPNANNEGSVRLSAAMINGAPVKLTQPDGSLYLVSWSTPAPTGVPLTVEFKLSAKVPPADERAGLLSSDTQSLNEAGGDYGAFSVSTDVSCLAGIIPMVPFARADGELGAAASGIGDLGTFDPSHFLVSVIVPEGHRVVLPGSLVGEVPEAGSRWRFTYALAAARELPILVTRGYQVATATVGDISVESHFFKDDADTGKKVLSHAANALAAAQEKLGPFPYRTFRVVQAFLANGAGGMEFPGLITVASSLYRGSKNPLSVLGMPAIHNDPLVAPLFASSMAPMIANTLEFTVDHEVAHQYIAMLVGSDPIDEPVADEPLTQAIAMLIMEWQHKPDLAAEIRSSQVKMAFQMMRLMNVADGTANRPTSEFSGNIEYAGLIYGKAALLFEAQRALVGHEVFNRALRTYVDENRYKWVTAKTFTSVLGRLSGRASAVEKLRRRWWEERHGDEDVGGLDLEAMFEGMVNGRSNGAANNGAAIDPALIEQYNAAMKALMGE